jgi:Domain of unknown function (DUF4158)
MEDESFKASPQEKRLKILASDEIKSIYGRPHFNYEERIEYFTLSHSDLEILEGFRSLKSQVHFILQLGYFRAKYLFFIFTLDEVEDDFQYIMERHFDSRQLGGITVIDKQTRLKQQRLILELYGYRNCTKEERQELEQKISNESIKYYASLVGYYSVFRLKQLNEWTAYLYLICFTYHRYQQRSDNLINCLIFRVRNYSDEAKSVAKERLQECHVEINENLQKAGQVLKLLTDESIDCDTPFKTFH